MNPEIIRMATTFCFLATVILIAFEVNSQNDFINHLVSDMDKLNHNQQVLQAEIISMTNSSQVIDGFNMTSQKCADGYIMHKNDSGMYHCDKEKTI